MSDAIKMVSGLDIGNGYVKGKVRVNDSETIFIDTPSSVSYTVSQNMPQTPSEELMNDLINELDATVVSRGIKSMDAGRVFFGKRGIRSGESQLEFNIDNTQPKCTESLSTMLVLGSIAACACSYAWKATGEVPAAINVECVLGIALPIEDYMDYKNMYRDTLMSDKHTVVINNFANTVNVTISFTNVVVLAEGAAGQFAITALGADFLQAALDFTREQGADIDSAYTGDVLMQARNTIGIDIGEGTVNFPVFQNGQVSIESSTSINKGYGTVLSAVVTELRNTNYAFSSRKELADFLLEENMMPAQKRVRDIVEHHLENQLRIFVRDIIKEYSNIFRKVGLRTDIIYVYGGGANPVRKFLYPALIEASKLDGDSCLPIIYLDSSYSRDLNRNGLFEAAEMVASN